ncbi:sesquipedalian-1-like [Tigriopus californicus]|nr:sesquipedalian-1-like [Tigriopus californicus]
MPPMPLRLSIMKINERTLISYATSADTPTDKVGWLWKRGEVNRNFQKRYFVLKGNLLFYFEKNTDKEPVGVIILEGCTIELAEEEQEKFSFKIVFHGEGKRTFILGTETPEVMEEWMKILASASYDYMKLMVLELEQQLSELDEAERRGGCPLVTRDGVSSPMNGHEPKAPPRHRSNPFNSREPGTKPSHKTWPIIHEEFGAKIVDDRLAWCLKVGSEKQSKDLMS